MKKRLAIIGANGFQNPLILKAKELGYETFVFAWKSGDIGEKTADHFIPISIIEKEKIWDFCKNNKIEACVSIGSDLATHTVNYIQRKLGKPCNPVITDLIATDKFEMRKALLDFGVSCPKFMKVDEQSDLGLLHGFRYPLIVKPTDRSGSRGIFKIFKQSELKKAIQESCGQSFGGQAIVEEFIEGAEYSCESISYNGKHTILQFTKKYTTGSPHFIETGHEEPSDIPAHYLEKIKYQICQGLSALKIRFGASHAEFKLDGNGDAHIIEIGARMGGDCIGSDLVPLSTGFDFVKMVIDVSLGKEPDFSLCGVPARSFIRFIFNKDDYLDYVRIKHERNVKIIREFVDNDVTSEVKDSSSRHGYYIYQMVNN